MPPLPPAAFEPAGSPPREGARGLRFWSIRHARGLSQFYRAFEAVLRRAGHWLAAWGLLDKAERPVVFVEGKVKGALFDCRMCGACILSASGLSCPMNCPKAMRNGPCGGVRANGNCEVYPDMPCVWAQGWEGAQRIPEGVAMMGSLQSPLDHRLKGASSWMRAMREGAGGNAS